MLDFDRVFRENEQFIFRYLVKLCGDPSLAEELTQETFFRAYMNYASLREKEKASAWLCQIAKNTYFSWFNERKKMGAAEELEGLVGDDSAEEMFLQKELSQKAFLCLHGLEEPYKEVFMLSVFGNVSLKEISEIFGKSESWARVTFYRAKQKLMEKMRCSYEM